MDDKLTAAVSLWSVVVFATPLQVAFYYRDRKQKEEASRIELIRFKFDNYRTAQLYG